VARNITVLLHFFTHIRVLYSTSLANSSYLCLFTCYCIRTAEQTNLDIRTRRTQVTIDLPWQSIIVL